MEKLGVRSHRSLASHPSTTACSSFVLTEHGAPTPRCAGTEGPFRAGSLGAKQALAARGFSEDAEALHTHDPGVGSVALHADSVDLDK